MKRGKYYLLFLFIISSKSAWAKDRLEPEMFLTITPYAKVSIIDSSSTDGSGTVRSSYNNVRYYKISPPTLERFDNNQNQSVLVFWRNNFPIIKGDKIIISAQPATGDSAVTMGEIKITRLGISYFFKKLPFTAVLDTGIKDMIPGDYMIEAYCKMGGGKKCSGILLFTLTESLEDPQAQAVAKAIAQATQDLTNKYIELQKNSDSDLKAYQERLSKAELDLATARANANKKDNTTSNPLVQVKEVVKEVKVVDNTKVNELVSENKKLVERLALLEKQNSDLIAKSSQADINKNSLSDKMKLGVFMVRGHGDAHIVIDYGDDSPTIKDVFIDKSVNFYNILIPSTVTVTMNGEKKSYQLKIADKGNYTVFEFGSGN